MQIVKMLILLAQALKKTMTVECFCGIIERLFLQE